MSENNNKKTSWNICERKWKPEPFNKTYVRIKTTLKARKSLEEIFKGIDFSITEEDRKSWTEELLTEQTDEEIDNLPISNLDKTEKKLRRDNYWVSTIYKDQKEGIGLWMHIPYEEIEKVYKKIKSPKQNKKNN